MILVYLTCFYGRPLLEVLYDMRLTIDDNESGTTFEDVINDILSQDNVMLSVKSTGAICEVNKTEMNLPLRVSDQDATIGDEKNRPWHIHVNLFETKEARFVSRSHRGEQNH
jgi:hypothetical protein